MFKGEAEERDSTKETQKGLEKGRESGKKPQFK